MSTSSPTGKSTETRSAVWRRFVGRGRRPCCSQRGDARLWCCLGHVPTDPADRLIHETGAQVQRDLWFPHEPLPLGHGQEGTRPRAGDDIVVLWVLPGPDVAVAGHAGSAGRDVVSKARDPESKGAALIGRGIAARRTDAADWSSTIAPAGSFDAAVAAVTDRLEQDGFTLRPVKHTETFFKFGVATPDDEAVEVRMGLDWPRYNPVEILMACLATSLPLSMRGMLQPTLRQIYRYDDRRSFLYGFDSDDVTDVRRVSSAVGDSLNDAAVTAFVVPDQGRRGALPITPSRRQRRAPLLALPE